MAKEASGRAPATVDCYRVRLGRLLRFLGDARVEQVRADDIRRWLLALKAGTKRPTSGTYVEGHRLAADGLFRWAVRERYLRRSPMDGIERFRADRPPIRTLTAMEIDTLLRLPSKSPNSLRNRAILAFLYDTGVRSAELARLTVGDVDLDTGQARVRGKNRRVEYVPLSPALVTVLRPFVRTRGSARPDDPFFCERGGRAITTNAIRLWMRRARAVAGLDTKRASPHVIRASAATHFAASGASAFSVQRFLRHRTPTMSQRYVDLASIDFVALHTRASPFQRLDAAHGRERPIADVGR